MVYDVIHDNDVKRTFMRRKSLQAIARGNDTIAQVELADRLPKRCQPSAPTSVGSWLNSDNSFGTM
jgi:hypothetical protein